MLITVVFAFSRVYCVDIMCAWRKELNRIMEIIQIWQSLFCQQTKKISINKMVHSALLSAWNGPNYDHNIYMILCYICFLFMHLQRPLCYHLNFSPQMFIIIISDMPPKLHIPVGWLLYMLMLLMQNETPKHRRKSQQRNRPSAVYKVFCGQQGCFFVEHWHIHLEFIVRFFTGYQLNVNFAFFVHCRTDINE